MELRKEILIDLGDFLAKFWSGREVFYVIDDRKTVAYSSVHTKEIVIPPPGEIPGDAFTRYRVWRWQTWHESMHIRFSPTDYNDFTLKGLIANIIEDYRVNTLGHREFPGMLPETIFYQSYVMAFFKPENYQQEMAVVVAFMTRLFTGTVPKGFESYDTDDVKAAVELVESELRKRSFELSAPEMRELVDKVMDLLKLANGGADGERLWNPWVGAPEVTWQEIQENADKIVKAMSEKKVGEEGGEERSKKDSGRQGEKELKEEVLGGSKTVREEFERIVAESKRLDKVEWEAKELVRGREKYKNIDNRLYVPRKLDEKTSELYNRTLITHLIAELRRLRRGWVEVRSREGDEVDVEEVIRKSPKPLVREERVRVGGLKVLILLDFSGSISPLVWLYKQSLVALGEALNAVGCKFAVFAFTRPYSASERSAVFLIKDFSEKWGVETARRLAQLHASGGTPLDEIYDFLKPYVEKWKPDVFITLTDGVPVDIRGYSRKEETREKIKELKMLTRMLAIAIGHDVGSAVQLSQNLKELGYDRSVAVYDLLDIPRKILWLLGEGA
jgi:hypothetical protein